MKSKRLVSVLLAIWLAALMPIGALAEEGAWGTGYESHVQSAVAKLQAMPALEVCGDSVVPDIAPQMDELPEGGMDDEMEPIEAEEFDGLEDEVDSIAQEMLAAAQDADGTMYSQLNERQRNCYNALAGVSIERILNAARDKSGHRQVKLSITGIQGITLNGRVNGSSFTPNTASAAVRKSVFTDLRLAIVALRYDRPDMVWLGDMSYGYGSQRVSGTQIRITTANYSFDLDFKENEGKMRDLMLACADVIANEARSLPDRYHQVMLVHDVLVKGNTYNHAAANKTISGIPYEMAHCGYSALIINDNYQPVCDGYAYAFKIVLSRLGIPCALPSSKTHMWNNVKMDDGRWYNVDVTWDDDDRDTICYDYFLIGSQTVVDGKAFCRQTSHVEENPFSPSTNTNPFTLYFPTKCSESYQYIGKDYPPLRFSDVGRDAWYYSHVEKAASQGLMNGVGNGRFNPEQKITRAEFAQLVANMMGADLSLYGGYSFSDVPTNQWYAPAVDWAGSNGLMQGSGGRFRPSDPISRQEMCVVLYNLARRQGLSTSGSYSRFADHNSIAPWARDAVYACKSLGIVHGDTLNYFNPTGNTMRCQAATVFVQFVDLQD